MTCQNLPIPQEIKFLFQHLMERGQVADIEDFNEENLHIFSKDVLQKIKFDETGWEQMVPAKVADLIKEKYLFGSPSQQMEFEY